MRKESGKGFLPALLCAALLLTQLFLGAAMAEEPELMPMTQVVLPGKGTVIRFTLAEAAACDLMLLDGEGRTLCMIAKNLEGREGENSVHWNGTWQGAAAPEGTWRLCLETAGKRTETPVTIGKMAPCLIGVNLYRATVRNGDQATARYYATEAGTLTVTLLEGDHEIPVVSRETEAGDGIISFSFHLAEGVYPLQLTLTDGEGIVSDAAQLMLTVTKEEIPPVFTPAHGSPWEGKDHETNFWTAPMDIADEETVWKALTAPMTVIDNGKGERGQIILRAEASAESEGIGTVTCDTQGVHVLERGAEWSLVECYSSSFFDSPILNWNALVQGYVPTKYLKEVLPDQKMGYVVDKLTQRLYLFMDGHLFSTLQISTGLANARQPYNETRSGEFLMTSKVGTFTSDDLYCGLEIRFNKGDLLHEVPYTLLADGTQNYRSTEPKLGTKASHGCIRVQRKRNPEGVNMSWIWGNHRKNTRIMIWEDWQGRQIPLPSDNLQLYYNPKGGEYYHRTDHCSRVNRTGVSFEAFRYGQLEEVPYRKLEWCEYCVPALRKAEIEKINARYAEGGDHDPVLTEARKTCPRSLKK